MTEEKKHSPDRAVFLCVRTKKDIDTASFYIYSVFEMH